jgi:hypothetical protein
MVCDAKRDAMRPRTKLRQFSLGGAERVRIRRVSHWGISVETDMHAAAQIGVHAKNGHSALRAATLFWYG